MDYLSERFNFDTDFFKNLFTESEETPVEDVYTDYDISGIGTLKLKLFDSKYFVQAVEFFRPFIRGFIVLLLGLYNIKMLLGFIRQDAGVITGKGSDISNGERSK